MVIALLACEMLREHYLVVEMLDFMGYMNVGQSPVLPELRD